MWQINNAFQVLAFVRSLVFGGIICLFFDIFRSLRKVRRFSDIQVFFQDIFLFIILSPTVFLFLVANTYGQIRGFVILGIIIGFLIVRFTFSKYFCFAVSYFFRFSFKVYSVITVKIKKFFGMIYCVFKNFFDLLVKNFKKSLILCKKFLKKE